MSLELTDLLETINQRHGTSLRLLERYASGEQGAYALVDERGARFVLKRYEPGRLAAVERAAASCARLRVAGYPAPEYVLVGTTHAVAYAVQRALPGSPAATLAPELLPQLVALVDIQRGLAPADGPGWPAAVLDPVLYGGPGFCLLEPMRRHSAATAELLEVAQTIARRCAGASFPSGDLVHLDLNPHNILVEDGRVTGVVDWEGALAGDRAFDLATLLFYGYEDEQLRAALTSAALERSGPAALDLYMAHLAHRQVEWSVRFHDQVAVTRWLRLARLVLGDSFTPSSPRARP